MAPYVELKFYMVPSMRRRQPAYDPEDKPAIQQVYHMNFSDEGRFEVKGADGEIVMCSAKDHEKSWNMGIAAYDVLQPAYDRSEYACTVTMAFYYSEGSKPICKTNFEHERCESRMCYVKLFTLMCQATEAAPYLTR